MLKRQGSFVSPSEFNIGSVHVRESIKRRLVEADTNKDGKLDADEIIGVVEGVIAAEKDSAAAKARATFFKRMACALTVLIVALLAVNSSLTAVVVELTKDVKYVSGDSDGGETTKRLTEGLGGSGASANAHLKTTGNSNVASNVAKTTYTTQLNPSGARRSLFEVEGARPIIPAKELSQPGADIIDEIVDKVIPVVPPRRKLKDGRDNRPRRNLQGQLCAPGCYDGWEGDGICDDACNVATCNMDGGDCAGQPPACAPGCPVGWPGDNYCDEPCNVAAHRAHSARTNASPRLDAPTWLHRIVSARILYAAGRGVQLRQRRLRRPIRAQQQPHTLSLAGF